MASPIVWSIVFPLALGTGLANRHAPDLLKFTAVILICWQGDRR